MNICSFDVDDAKKYGVKVAVIMSLMKVPAPKDFDGRWKAETILALLPFFKNVVRVRRVLEEGVLKGAFAKETDSGVFSRRIYYRLNQ